LDPNALKKGDGLAHLALDAVVIVSETSVQTIRHILRPRKVGWEEPFYVAVWLSGIEVEPRVSKASNAYGRKYPYVAYFGIIDSHRDNVRALQRQTPKSRKTECWMKELCCGYLYICPSAVGYLRVRPSTIRPN